MKNRLGRISRLAGGFGLLLALVLIFTALPAYAILPLNMPNWYWSGNENPANGPIVAGVFVCGQPAPQGTAITARLYSNDGVTYLGMEYATTTDSLGNYGIPPNEFAIPSDDPNTPQQDGGLNGNIIKFYVNGQYAAQHVFEIGGTTRLDLTVPGGGPYTLTLSVSPMGAGTAAQSGSGTYACGATANITATASPCYQFVNWTNDFTSTANPASVVMMKNMNITANFQKIQYTLSTNVTAGQGAINANPLPGQNGKYDCGTLVSLTAVPANACWVFAGWGGALSGTTNPATVNMTSDLTVTASFTQLQYTLTISTVGQGSVAANPLPGGNGKYNCGTSVQLTANADPGWQFSAWSGALSGSANPASLPMDADKSVTATFTLIPPASCPLNVSVTGSGIVLLSPPGGSYPCGSSVNVTAVTDSCWLFDHWGGALSGNTNPTSVVVSGTTNITANFVLRQYTLTTNVTGQGSVTPNPLPGQNGKYDCGTQVQLTATPANACWQFAGWSGAASGTTNPVTVPVDADMSVTANFTLRQYTLTISVVGSGAVMANPPPGGNGKYDCGTVVQLTANADPGWQFSSWSGALSGNTSPSNLTMDADKSVTATFTEQPAQPCGLPIMTLQLCQGWNILSTPITLAACCDTWGEFVAYNGLNLDPAGVTYYFDASCQMYKQVLSGFVLMPCDAVYVKLAAAGTAQIVPSPNLSVSSKDLLPGWNLISLASLQNMGVKEALTSVYRVTGDRTGYTQVLSPANCQTAWVYVRDGAGNPLMVPGKGYWAFMINGGSLGGFTTTP